MNITTPLIFVKNLAPQTSSRYLSSTSNLETRNKLVKKTTFTTIMGTIDSTTSRRKQKIDCKNPKKTEVSMN